MMHEPDHQYLNDFKRDKVDPRRGADYNTAKIPKGWTQETVRTTFEIVMWAHTLGYWWALEVYMKNGRRADVIIPELYGSQAIEVVDSESEESIEAKRQDYADIGVEMLAVPADYRRAIEMIREANGMGRHADENI